MINKNENIEICRGCGCPKTEWKLIDGILTCPYCHNHDDNALNLTSETARKLDEISKARDDFDFAKSLSLANELLTQDKENPEINWYALLAQYQIVYTKNGDGKYVPTFLCPEQKISIPECDFYKFLSPERKRSADQIEMVRQQAVAEYKKIKPYDVFISYKQHNEITKGLTQESAWARDIYEELAIKNKYRVFYDEKSLRGENVGWEPHIYAALKSSKILLLLGSDIKNMSATWVKNEWKRFLFYKKSGDRKQIAVLGGYGVDPTLLPDEELRKTQMVSANSADWMTVLSDRVKKACSESFDSTIIDVKQV